MSDQSLTLLQGAATQLPAAIRNAMGSQTVDEMQSNVGTSYAVVSIKGKTFTIKHGGQNQMITTEINGQQYVSPFFDVVIPKARAELSKTYYRNGYSDGDDSAPDCWSEDGVTPLAPLAQRPIDPATNAPCVDCRMCPKNVFGSKKAEDPNSQSNGKACADTRKIVILPVDPRTNQLDADNIKYGGPMMLRVPAASLKIFAEYSGKLQAMGVPYYGVVTRLEFDQTQAFPKFQLKALRYLTEPEAAAVIETRNSPRVTQILESGQTGAPAQPAIAGQLAPSMQQAAPQQAQVAPQVPAQATPVPPAAPSNVVPLAPVQVAQPVPQPAPAPVPAAPPSEYPGIQLLPNAPYTLAQYKAAGWTADQIVEAGAAARVGQAVQAAAPPPPMQAVNAPAVAAAPSPAAPVTATPSLLNTVDSLLNS